MHNAYTINPSKTTKKECIYNKNKIKTKKQKTENKKQKTKKQKQKQTTTTNNNKRHRYLILRRPIGMSDGNIVVVPSLDLILSRRGHERTQRLHPALLIRTVVTWWEGE